MRSALLLIAIAAAASAADRTEAEVLKDIADAKKKLVALEIELATVKGEKTLRLNAKSIEVGVVGRFGSDADDFEITVDEIINDKQMVAEIGSRPRLRVLIDRFPNAGLSKGKILKDPPVWKVSGTTKWNGEDMYEVRPFVAEPPKVAPKKK